MRAYASSICMLVVTTLGLAHAQGNSTNNTDFTVTNSPTVLSGSGSNDGSSFNGSVVDSGSDSLGIDISAYPFCSNTDFSNIYTNGNVSSCEVLTKFSFVNPFFFTTTVENATSICSVAQCYYTYEQLMSMSIPECVVKNDVLLYRNILDPLTDSNCTGIYLNSTNPLFTVSDPNDSSSGYVPVPTPSAESESSKSTTVAAIVSIAVAAVLVFVAAVVAIVWYKRQRLRHIQASFRDPLMEEKIEASLRRHSLNGSSTVLTEGSEGPNSREIVLDNVPVLQHQAHGSSLWADEDLLAHHMRNEDLEDIRVIGYGGHGVVFLVRYRQNRLLASKRLVKDHLTREKTRALIAEIKLVSKLEHPCIVQFVGAAWTTEADLQALFEYMPNGDLCTYLAKTIQDTTWNLTKLRMAMDIAEALIYVHSFAPPLVHRDLKSNNVLLTEDMRGKLSDFGVSRFQSDACTMTLGVGSGRWLAPEVMAGGGEYNQSCDIYSLGVVLSEMDTHRLPFSDLRSASGNPMAEVSILQLVTLGKLKPTFSESCPESIRAIALRCLAFNPKERPNAIEVSYALRTIAKKEFGM